MKMENIFETGDFIYTQTKGNKLKKIYSRFPAIRKFTKSLWNNSFSI